MVVYVTYSNPNKVVIDPYADDPFYRYKTSQLKIRKMTNRTILENLDEVARDLNTLPILIIKFISHTLGVCGKFDKKKSYWYLQTSSITIDELNTTVVEFIRKIVICCNCGLPELLYIGSKSKKYVKIRCCSCGWLGLDSDLQIEEKLMKIFRRHIMMNDEKDTVLNMTNRYSDQR